MEFLAEFLFEFVGGVFLENGIEAASDRRLPSWLRTLILTVTALVFTAVSGIILLVGAAALRHTLWISLICFALDAGLIFLSVQKVRRALRARSRQ